MKSAFRTIEIGEQPCPNGLLRHVTVKSRYLKGRADCSVYVPSQAKRGQSVPLVILLHGVYGSHWSWNLNGNAYLTLQGMIDRGEIPPMILATPSDGLWGDGSGYFAHGGLDFEKWITEDVPQLVTEVTENAHLSPVFLAGLSMGGYGALRLGARFPDLFRAIAGHSSITVFQEFAQFIEEPLDAYGDPPGDSLDVFTALQSAAANLPPIRIDCGTEDPLIDGNRRLHGQLEEAGIAHLYEEFSGGHEWPYWSEHLQKTLAFFAEVLGTDVGA